MSNRTWHEGIYFTQNKKTYNLTRYTHWMFNSTEKANGNCNYDIKYAITLNALVQFSQA